MKTAKSTTRPANAIMTNIAEDRLGFVKGAFKQLAEVSHLDLGVGMAFSGEIGAALHQALKDAADTIARMPAST